LVLPVTGLDGDDGDDDEPGRVVVVGAQSLFTGKRTEKSQGQVNAEQSSFSLSLSLILPKFVLLT